MQKSNLSDDELIIIYVCVSVAGIIIGKKTSFNYHLFIFVHFLAIILVLLGVALVKYHGRNENESDITLKSYNVKPSNEEGNQQCVYSNPTYQDVQNVDNIIDIHPTTTFQNVQAVDETADVTPNPTYQDVQDGDNDEFSVTLEN